MDYEKMWNELKDLLQRTDKMTDLIKPTGVLEIISEIENTEYLNKNGDLPF